MVKGKILIVVGGKKARLAPFKKEGQSMGLSITTASFSELNFVSEESGKFTLKVGKKPISGFDLIYIFLVGKRLEEASLLANYARQEGVRIVDSLYENQHLMPSSVSKAMETKLLMEGGVPVPKTFFASLEEIKRQGSDLLEFPFVIKSTRGKKARDVWAPQNQKELEEICDTLSPREKGGEHFFAQEFVKASQRIRVLVVGRKAVAAITRPTKWRKRFVKKVNGEVPEGKKEALKKIPQEIADLALKAAEAVSLEISGVDILVEDVSGNPFVIEANAAPSWKLITKDTGINVEQEIMSYLRDILNVTDKTGEQIKTQYQVKFEKFGYDPRSLNWKRLGASHQRFRQMWAEIDFNGKSVLDVGCGFGEMARFLRKRYEGVSYTGVDLVPEFIQKAKVLYPEYKFETRDYFQNPGKEKFDVVLASGVLNSNVESNLEYRKKAIKTMFEHTNNVLAFNMLGGHPQPETKKGSNVWYADSLEILKFCLTLTRRVILREHYNPKDFTILMHRVEK